MRQSTRHRIHRLAGTGFTLGVGSVLLGLTLPTPAIAAETPAYSASSSASVFHVSALDSHPFGINLGPLVDLKVSTAGSTVDSTKTPRSEAAAAHLDLAVNRRLPDVPNVSVRQTAPPDNPTPTELNASPLNIAGLAEVGVGHVKAHARWNESSEKPEPSQLTNSSVSLANLALLPGANLTGPALPTPIPLGAAPVLSLPDIAYAHSRTDIVDVKDQDGHGVQAQSRISLAQVVLFKGTPQQIVIKVISPPTLTATATGTERSNVKYQAPILEIVTADGKSQRIDDPHAVVEIPLVVGSSASDTTQNAAPAQGSESTQESGSIPSDLPAQNGDLDGVVGGVLGGVLGAGGAGAATVTPQTAKQQPALLRLSIGDLQKSITPTKVSAEAASIRLQVLDVPHSGTLLDVALGQLKAAAKVPAGGLTPPPSDSTTPTQTSKVTNPGGGSGSNKGDKLPVTGSKIGILLAAGAALVIGGRLIQVLAKRRITPTA